MKSSDLAKPDSWCHESYKALIRLLGEANVKYNKKVYLDSYMSVGNSWLDNNVYLHGDRNVVNMVALKLVRWQLMNLKAGDGFLYVYPAEDMV